MVNPGFNHIGLSGLESWEYEPDPLGDRAVWGIVSYTYTQFLVVSFEILKLQQAT